MRRFEPVLNVAWVPGDDGVVYAAPLPDGPLAMLPHPCSVVLMNVLQWAGESELINLLQAEAGLEQAEAVAALEAITHQLIGLGLVRATPQASRGG